MSKLSQSKAVYTTTINALNDAGIDFQEGETMLGDVITPEVRASIIGIVTEGFLGGTIELKDTEANSAKLADPKKMKSYVSGLVSNWHRKDKRFNGGQAYEVKNKGSRSSDPQLKALKGLYKKFSATDSEQAAKIQEAIDMRIVELHTEKAKAVEINANDLPEEFKHLA